MKVLLGLFFEYRIDHSAIFGTVKDVEWEDEKAIPGNPLYYGANEGVIQCSI